MEETGVRLNKFLSAAGICSRREADREIEAGRVLVDGRPAVAGQKVLPGQKVTFRGRTVEEKPRPVLLMVNKPRGIVCTTQRRDRDNIVDFVRYPQRVYPVGRLDVDSQGLLFLTNDGAFAQALLHPSHGAEKLYRVTVTGLRPDSIRRLCRLRELDGEAIRPARVSLIGEDKAAATLLFAIHEGKKRQIRRMCARVGLSVRQLCRVSEGGIQLGDLPEGAWRPLTAEEIRPILDQRR